MKYYIDENNKIYAYEDNDNKIKPGLTSILDEDLEILRTPSTEVQLELDINNIKSTIQKHLNKTAVSLGYDSIDTIAKYIGYDNRYRLQAESLGSWTSEVWGYIEDELIKVQNGTRTLPTKDEVLLEIPQYIGA